MKIKPIQILLTLSLTISMLTPALASEITTPGNTSTSDIPLTVQATTLSVTVPTQLLVTIDSEGAHTYATDVAISNSSSGPVSVTGISMQTKNSWELASYSDNMSTQPVGSKKLGFRINGSETISNSNSLQSIPEHFGPISSGSKLRLDYAANIPPQDKAITTTSIADIIFTIDWYTGGNSVAETDKGLLALDKENLQMMPGTQEVIYATYQETPSTLMLMSLDESTGIDWNSSNPSAATVENGVVTGVGTGNTVITAKANDLVATCSVTVVEPPVPLTAIAFSKRSTSIVNGMEETVLVIYNPEKFTGATDLTLTSANESIVKATPTYINGVTASDGPTAIKLQAVGTGSTTITASATTSSGLVTDTINVAVTQPLTGLEITGETSVKVGETIQLTANKLPANTTDTSDIIWLSSDETVATVDSNGVVTGASVGTASIDVSCGELKSIYNVEVISRASTSLNKYKMNTALKDLTGTITFSTESPEGKEGTDISSSGDKSVIAVKSGQNATVYANGGCFAPADSSQLFLGYKARQLKLGGLDTSKATDMNSMFSNCTSITSIDLSSFDTSNVTNMSYMFSSCTSITNLELGNFNTSNVTDMACMFWKCTSLIGLDLSSFNTSKVTDMAMMFENSSGLGSIDISSFNTSNVTTMQDMFSGCKGLTALDLSNFDTAKVINTQLMFSDCSKLVKLDISNFNTSNIKTMERLFNNCSSLINLDLSSFDTSKVTDMSQMFKGCTNLNTVNLSSFNTSKVTSMQSMFSGCSNLTSLDLSAFNTSNVTSMQSMFYQCSSIITLDLSTFDTSKLTSLSGMFMYCSKLTDIYAKTQIDADKFKSSTNRPATAKVTVKVA